MKKRLIICILLLLLIFTFAGCEIGADKPKQTLRLPSASPASTAFFPRSTHGGLRPYISLEPISPREPEISFQPILTLKPEFSIEPVRTIVPEPTSATADETSAPELTTVPAATMTALPTAVPDVTPDTTPMEKATKEPITMRPTFVPFPPRTLRPILPPVIEPTPTPDPVIEPHVMTPDVTMRPIPRY